MRVSRLRDYLKFETYVGLATPDYVKDDAAIFGVAYVRNEEAGRIKSWLGMVRGV